MKLSRSFLPRCFENISMNEVLNMRYSELRRRKMNIVGVKFKIVILIQIENVIVKALINGQTGPIQNVHFVSDNRPVSFSPGFRYTHSYNARSLIFPYGRQCNLIKKLHSIFNNWDAVKSKIATKNQPLYFSSPDSTKRCGITEARICL